MAYVKVLVTILALAVVGFGNAPKGVIAADPDPLQDFCIADLTATGPIVNGFPSRLDLNPGGIIMPHTHNLASEILFCLEGEFYTGFVTNSGNPTVPNKLYAKFVVKGEAFTFPRGLVHFQLNKGKVPAVSLGLLNGHNPGIQLMPVALFGTGVDPALLAKSFFISEKQVADLASILSHFASAPV